MVERRKRKRQKGGSTGGRGAPRRRALSPLLPAQRHFDGVPVQGDGVQLVLQQTQAQYPEEEHIHTLVTFVLKHDWCGSQPHLKRATVSYPSVLTC